MLDSGSSSQITRAVAIYLCEKSGWALTHLQIHKLLYLANMYHLQYYESNPMIDQKFEAWIYGPVLPELYHDLKYYGPDVVSSFPYTSRESVGDSQKSVIDFVYDSYGQMTVKELIELTHRDGGGWAKNWAPNFTFRGRVISDEDILLEFRILAKESNVRTG